MLLEDLQLEVGFQHSWFAGVSNPKTLWVCQAAMSRCCSELWTEWFRRNLIFLVEINQDHPKDIKAGCGEDKQIKQNLCVWDF